MVKNMPGHPPFDLLSVVVLFHIQTSLSSGFRNFEAKRDIKISTHLVTRLNRQYSEIKQRYKDLHISSDFTNAIASWTLHKELNHQQMMRNPPHFVLDSKFVIPVRVFADAKRTFLSKKHVSKSGLHPFLRITPFFTIFGLIPA